MSLTKKDPSLRVAANDPHLVSLGGGRLSTAVTIHYIPTGHTTIGSSSSCSISLNGVGVQPNHCTIYRSEENEVYIVPEPNASLLLDGLKITKDTKLSQGAMLTIGQYNLLRFNNPAEAELMRSAMDSNEQNKSSHSPSNGYAQRNSSKSLDSPTSLSSLDIQQALEIEHFYQTNINPLNFMEEEVKVLLNGGKPSMKHVPPIDINGLQCPKVFTADLVTVNMPAKDVLGQKYASFAKNLAENHRQEKQINNCSLRNNQVNLVKQQNQGIGNQPGNYANIPKSLNPLNSNSGNNKSSGSTEYLTKVNNNSPLRIQNSAASTYQSVYTSPNHSPNHHQQNSIAYDRYPKPGSYGNLQIYPMNNINTEINNGSNQSSPLHHKSQETSPSFAQTRQLTQLSNGSSNSEGLEDMLKICSEYTERSTQQQQHYTTANNNSSNSITSSPIVQNRIKTNGSLPREKKSPFHQELTNMSTSSNSPSSNTNNHTKTANSTGYENVRLLNQSRNESQTVFQQNGLPASPLNSPSAGSTSGYENVIVGKYVPQSPRTKIRTTCLSPKKDYNFSNYTSPGYPMSSSVTTPPPPNPKPKNLKLPKHTEYEQLIKTFEEKLKIEMQAIEESSRYKPPPAPEAPLQPAKRSNKNINNLTLTIHKQTAALSPKLPKKPAPAPRNLNKSSSGSCGTLQQLPEPVNGCTGGNSSTDLDQMKQERKNLLASIQSLKEEISELRKQEDEVLRDLDMEKALLSAELYSVSGSVQDYEKQLDALQEKIRRLEAQRNATRVMEENQQAKLKQSIEMKQDQIKKLKEMLKQKPNNECLKEEIHNVTDSLENERKAFEDLEFQYLEEESEWHAYREELHADETTLTCRIREKRFEFMNLEKQELSPQVTDAKSIKQNLMQLFEQLKTKQDQLKLIEQNISDVTGELQLSSSDEEDSKVHFDPSIDDTIPSSNLVNGLMSQSLFGSAEILCPKRSGVEDLMSKSVNENLFYNNKIEFPNNSALQATSTPKRPKLRLVNIDEGILNENSPPSPQQIDQGSISPVVKTAPPIILRVKRQKTPADSDSELLQEDPNENDANGLSSERLKCNLSLGSDDFEVNPLEKRVPSQDDIDRICKVTSDAPISTKGAATTKIFDSIKEIERNRQLLLAQQGHHVIEHERQKMHDLKKKSHDEARAQYLSMLSQSNDGRSSCCDEGPSSPGDLNACVKMEGRSTQMELQTLTGNKEQLLADKENQTMNSQNAQSPDKTPKKVVYTEEANQQRHSQPEFESQHLKQQHTRNSRPLSEANSEYSCGDPLSDGKSSLEFSTTNTSSGIGSDSRDEKRASSHSNDTTSATISLNGSGVFPERKRPNLPKHQRPLTRYLPIFSPDLNLRQHIESAGHQIALCPHVSVDSYSCRGYLRKLGATLGGWARRWFVLDRQRKALIYYSDKSERKPRGGAYFSTIDEVYLDHLNDSKSGRPHCTFIVKTKKRIYQLQAASDAAARIWMDAIITGAQGNLEY